MNAFDSGSSTGCCQSTFYQPTTAGTTDSREQYLDLSVMVQITAGMEVYDVIGYQIDPVDQLATAIDLHDIMGYVMDQVDPITDQMDPVNPVTIGIVFCSEISYKMVSVECELELYFEFEFESINVKCELDFYHNEYDYSPPIRASTVDLNMSIRIAGNIILECMFDALCNVNNENFCNNGFDCGVLSQPTHGFDCDARYFSFTNLIINRLTFLIFLDLSKLMFKSKEKKKKCFIHY